MQLILKKRGGSLALKEAAQPILEPREVREIVNGPSVATLSHILRQRQKLFEEWMQLAFGRDKRTWHQLPGRDMDIAGLTDVRSAVWKAKFHLLNDESTAEERREYFDRNYRIWLRPPEDESYVSRPEEEDLVHLRRFSYPALSVSTPTDREVVTVTLGHLAPEPSAKTGWVLTNKEGRHELTPATFYGVNSR
ncbi:MAG: hypothetical protein AAB802_02420 [Patescibacteria group bacterium]